MKQVKNLKVELLGTQSYWYYGHPEIRNFGKPNSQIAKGGLQGKGLYSADGMASIDDSGSYIFNEDGRGSVFDRLVKELNFDENVSTLVYIYRYHFPNISLYSESIPLLNDLKEDYRLALITDGRSFVQKRKVDALNY